MTNMGKEENTIIDTEPQIEGPHLQAPVTQTENQKNTLKLPKFALPLFIIVVLIIAIIWLLVVYNSELSNKVEPSNQAAATKSSELTVTPNPLSKPIVGIMGEIPVITQHITYRKDKSIFWRDLTNNKLSSEKEIVTAENVINYYSVSKDLKYVAYSYFSDTTLRDKLDDMSGSGDTAVVKDLATGNSTKILSNLTKDNLIASFSFTNKLDELFIGLDNDDIYKYNISENQIKKIYSGSSNDSKSYCRGYFVTDESPNGENLIIRSRCFEGTITYILKVNSGTLTKIGENYIGGTRIIKFLNDSEIYGIKYGETESDHNTRYVKLNLQGGIIQELSEPTAEETPKNIFALYHESGTDLIFIADESKSKVPYDVDLDSRQNIGNEVKDIYTFPSPQIN